MRNEFESYGYVDAAARSFHFYRAGGSSTCLDIMEKANMGPRNIRTSKDCSIIDINEDGDKIANAGEITRQLQSCFKKFELKARFSKESYFRALTLQYLNKFYHEPIIGAS